MRKWIVSLTSLALLVVATPALGGKGTGYIPGPSGLAMTNHGIDGAPACGSGCGSNCYTYTDYRQVPREICETVPVECWVDVDVCTYQPFKRKEKGEECYYEEVRKPFEHPVKVCKWTTVKEPAKVCKWVTVKEDAKECKWTTVKEPAKICKWTTVKEPAKICKWTTVKEKAKVCKWTTVKEPAKICKWTTVKEKAKVCKWVTVKDTVKVCKWVEERKDIDVSYCVTEPVKRVGEYTYTVCTPFNRYEDRSYCCTVYDCVPVTRCCTVTPGLQTDCANPSGIACGTWNACQAPCPPQTYCYTTTETRARTVKVPYKVCIPDVKCETKKQPYEYCEWVTKTVTKKVPAVYCKQVLVDEQVDVCKMVWVDTEVDVCKPVWVDTTVDVCKMVWVDTEVDVCKPVWVDTTVDVCKQVWVDTTVDVCKPVWVDTKVDVCKMIWEDTTVDVCKMIWVDDVIRGHTVECVRRTRPIEYEVCEYKPVMTKVKQRCVKWVTRRRVVCDTVPVTVTVCSPTCPSPPVCVPAPAGY